MKGEMKSQEHSTVSEYQVPFGCPSPGESYSLSSENSASSESLATIPDEGHSLRPDENTDDIVLSSDSAHDSSDAQIRSLLGLPPITASTRSCNSRKESPLRQTPSPGSVPLYPQGAISNGEFQDPYPYFNATDIAPNSSYDIYSPTQNPLFQQNESQSYSDVAPIISCPSAYPSAVGEMQPVQLFSASSNIYTQGAPTYAPATSGPHYFPDAPFFSVYERSNPRAYAPRARSYPPSRFSRGMRHMTHTSPRSLEFSDRNFYVSGSQQYHPYPRCAQLPQDAEQGYSQKTPFGHEARSSENFVNSSPPFQSSGNIIDEGSSLYQPSQQKPPFPNPELHLGDFPDYMEPSLNNLSSFSPGFA